ncbi:MAG: CD225/dispanin family protein [Prevotella sp.]|nr:CD225/dispanin family protein [Prevotella sp.]
MKYYIIQNGQQMGPYTIEQLKIYHVTPETDVWTEGMANWAKAKDVPALASLFAGMGAAAMGAQPQAAPNSGQYQQPSGNNQYQQAQPASYGGYPPKTWVAEAILVTLFCCMPFGIVGLVHATMVSLYYNRGEFEAAEQASRTAGKWVKIAFIIGLVVIILYVILILVMGVSLNNAYRRGMFGY